MTASDPSGRSSARPSDRPSDRPPADPRLVVPPSFLALPDRDDTWQPWLAALPRTVADLLDDWHLTTDGAPRHGECALVLPVRDADGAPAALKVTWPHWEAEHEHLALQHWHGEGAVLLLRADPHRWALLLERARPTTLDSLDDTEACTVAGELLHRLHRPAPPQLRLLSAVLAGWAERLAALPRSAPLPRRQVEHALSLARDLVTDPATDGTLVHADAHGGNVLAADREPWLVIDPKPLSGDPHYEPAPLLWNRWSEVLADPWGVRGAIRRRLDASVDALGLDWDRARDWVVVRAAVTALWTLEDAAARPGRTTTGDDAAVALTDADRDALTRAVTVSKAVLD
jgi:streptomycin 6-kinase